MSEGGVPIALEVDGLRKAYRKRGSKEEARGVEEISFQVARGEFFTLLGPSGCGKTTTLRCIAGLELPDKGVIRIESTAVVDTENKVLVPANRRGLGMVFQSYAIWPHMTVSENVAFPLKYGPDKGSLGRNEVDERVESVLRVVELHDYAKRRATALSGGQQQRLALARALVMRPSVLLLDEPLSNLDASLRDTMRLELKRIQRELNITTIYVTHDQKEALTLSNRIAVLHDGLVIQMGRPREIYEEPNSEFVASFVGTVSWVHGEVVETLSDGGVRVKVAGTATVVARRVDGSLSVGSRCRMAIRPELVSLEESSARERRDGEISVRVVNRAYQGESVVHVVDLAGDELKVEGSAALSVPPGETVFIELPQAVPLAVPVGSPPPEVYG